MEKEIFFKIEKLIQHDGKTVGYFVEKGNKPLIKNPIQEMMKMYGMDMDSMGEQYKAKAQQSTEEKLFFPTKKEALDFIIYSMDSF